jgi:hypothetical protein
MLYGAISFVIIASIAYIYFLCASVAHVVVRKEVTQEIATVSSNIGTLESEYIAAQHAVSVNVATMRGFTLAETKVFIAPAKATFVLSKNNDS